MKMNIRNRFVVIFLLSEFVFGAFSQPFESSLGLYDCPSEASLSPVAACTHAHAISRPEISVPRDLTKPNAGSADFPIVLTAQSTFVNLFSRHFDADPPNLQLSSSLQISADINRTLTEVWSFNGGFPGPTIRASLGDTLQIQMRNLLHVTVGLFVPGVFNAREPLEDGFLKPGETKLISIPLTQVGVFQYHSAVDPQRQVAMGLYGALIVTDGPPSLDDSVLLIGTPAVDVGDWQILAPFEDGKERAEEQYNGRYGNVVLVNGHSTSSGPQLSLISGARHSLHLINVANSRSFKVSVADLKFRVETQWCGADVMADEYAEEMKESVILPPGATATISIDVDDQLSGREFNIVTEDAIAPKERRRAILKGKSGATSASVETPLISETWTAVNPRSRSRVVELLLIPSNDGLLNKFGFTDSLDIPKTSITTGVDDVAMTVENCEEGKSCGQPSWGFKVAGFSPRDAEVVDASLLFEAFCPSGVLLPRIDVKLFPVGADELTGTHHVPNVDAVFANMTMEPLAHSIVACTGMLEVPIDLRNQRLEKYIQASLMESSEGRESLVWLRASFEYISEAAEGTPAPQLLVATRAGSELPPPTLRLVYKTFNFNAAQVTRQTPTRPQDLKAQRRRLENIFHELRNDQQDMKAQLHILYDRVKQRQRRLKASKTGKEETDGGDKMKRSQQLNQNELVYELETHLKQQEEQRLVERKLIGLKDSDLPPAYKQQLTIELQHQLQKHYLQQQVHQRSLKRKLEYVNSANPEFAAGGGAFRGAQSDPAGVTEAEAKLIKQEKILYLKLYKHYNDLVGQMRHLKSAAEALVVAPLGRGLLPDESQSRMLNFFGFTELEAPDPYNYLTPQILLRLKIVQGLTVSAMDAPPSRIRHSFSEGVKKSNFPDGHQETNNIKSPRAFFLDSSTKSILPHVLLTLGQAVEADFSGHLPMWISSGVFHQTPGKSDLTPGSKVIWEIVNPTPTTHVLYFHRVLLEMFEYETVDSNGNVTTHTTPDDHKNNGHFFGITVPGTMSVPGTPSGDVKAVVIRAISKVPYLTGNNRVHDLYRWDVRIQSSILEHIANGVSTRVHFKVLPSIDSKELPSGIGFADLDEYEDETPPVHVAVAAAACGVVVLGGLVGMRMYQQPTPQRKRRFSGLDDPVSRPLEMTPATLSAGSPIIGENKMIGGNFGFGEQEEGGPHTYLASPGPYKQVKHRPGASTPGSALTSRGAAPMSPSLPI